MFKNPLRIAALAVGLAVPGVASAAFDAVVTTNLNLRGGPSASYERYATIPAGDEVTVYGCLTGYNWCDVDWYGNRGWVSGNYLAYLGSDYYRRPIASIGVTIGVPVVRFDRDVYFRRYYGGRPPVYREVRREYRRDFRDERRRDRWDAREDRRDGRRDFREERRDDRRDFREERRDDRRDVRQQQPQQPPVIRDNRQDAGQPRRQELPAFGGERREGRPEFRQERREDRGEVRQERREQRGEVRQERREDRRDGRRDRREELREIR